MSYMLRYFAYGSNMSLPRLRRLLDRIERGETGDADR